MHKKPSLESFTNSQPFVALGKSIVDHEGASLVGKMGGRDADGEYNEKMLSKVYGKGRTERMTCRYFELKGISQERQLTTQELAELSEVEKEKNRSYSHWDVDGDYDYCSTSVEAGTVFLPEGGASLKYTVVGTTSITTTSSLSSTITKESASSSSLKDSGLSETYDVVEASCKSSKDEKSVKGIKAGSGPEDKEKEVKIGSGMRESDKELYIRRVEEERKARLEEEAVARFYFLNAIAEVRTLTEQETKVYELGRRIKEQIWAKNRPVSDPDTMRYAHWQAKNKLDDSGLPMLENQGLRSSRVGGDLTDLKLAYQKTKTSLKITKMDISLGRIKGDILDRKSRILIELGKIQERAVFIFDYVQNIVKSCNYFVEGQKRFKRKRDATALMYKVNSLMGDISKTILTPFTTIESEVKQSVESGESVDLMIERTLTPDGYKYVVEGYSMRGQMVSAIHFNESIARGCVLRAFILICFVVACMADPFVSGINSFRRALNGSSSYNLAYVGIYGANGDGEVLDHIQVGGSVRSEFPSNEVTNQAVDGIDDVLMMIAVGHFKNISKLEVFVVIGKLLFILMELDMLYILCIILPSATKFLF